MNALSQMLTTNHKNSTTIAVAAIVCFTLSFGMVSLFAEYAPYLQAQAPAAKDASSEPAAVDTAGWTSIQSSHFTVYCERGVDPAVVARRLGSGGVSFFGGRSDLPPDRRIAERLDVLFRRVTEILDMHPRMPKIAVKIFGSNAALSNEYRKMFKTSKQGMKAFYVHKYRTIYTSERDITDSIIAHEMAHAVIDSYFRAIPPEKVAEIMASYVDLHLEDSY